MSSQHLRIKTSDKSRYLETCNSWQWFSVLYWQSCIIFEDSQRWFIFFPSQLLSYQIKRRFLQICVFLFDSLFCLVAIFSFDRMQLIIVIIFTCERGDFSLKFESNFSSSLFLRYCILGTTLVTTQK